MVYIAYGSNMVEEQMARRCPGAKLLGTGWLPNHRLEFYLHATVERSRARGACVPVALWEIDREHERSLDRYEGVPSYYTKRTETVVMEDGSQIEGMLYVMNLIRPHPPTLTYYAAIRDAYIRLGFGRQIGRVLIPALYRAAKRK